MINYKGNFLNQLYKLIEENEELTIGELMFSFLREQRLKGKHYFYATDEDIYNSLEALNKEPKEEDEPLDEVSFSFWVEQTVVMGKNKQDE